MANILSASSSQNANFQKMNLIKTTPTFISNSWSLLCHWSKRSPFFPLCPIGATSLNDPLADAVEHFATLGITTGSWKRHKHNPYDTLKLSHYIRHSTQHFAGYILVAQLSIKVNFVTSKLWGTRSCKYKKNSTINYSWGDEARQNWMESNRKRHKIMIKEPKIIQ